VSESDHMRQLLTKSNITDYGLCFFFEVGKDLVISTDFIKVLYQAIVRIVRLKTQELVEVPEMPGLDAEGNDPTEEEKAQAQQMIDAANAKNAEIEKQNEYVNKLKSKVKVEVRPHIEGGSECAFLKLNNYREPRPES